MLHHGPTPRKRARQGVLGMPFCRREVVTGELFMTMLPGCHRAQDSYLRPCTEWADRSLPR